jgi:hypothetical protein
VGTHAATKGFKPKSEIVVCSFIQLSTGCDNRRSQLRQLLQ